MAKRTTINDLAKALKLSPTLISMVLNGKGDQNKISKETQKRVLIMAQKMGYTPNQSARALRTGKSNVIGLIIPDISNPFYSSLAKKFEELLKESGYRLIAGSTDEDPDKELRLIRVFMDQNVDGLIVASTLENDEPYRELMTAGKPVVFFDRIFDNKNISGVTVENRKGAAMAIRLFLEAGRRYIGFLTLTPAHISTLRERRNGFLEACEENHLGNCENRVYEVRFEDIENRFPQAMDDFLQSHPQMDAVLIANNNLTFHMMRYKRASKDDRVKKLAIISFDDHMAFEFSDPGISAISQPVADIARSTITLILEMLRKTDSGPRQIKLPVEIQQRSSH